MILDIHCHAGCNTCCNVSEDNQCGVIVLPGHNNCGGHGQQCFQCGKTESCAKTDGGDYCAPLCMPGVDCQGCCGTGKMMQQYCFRGDQDYDCGKAGARCVACPMGLHCLNHMCQ